MRMMMAGLVLVIATPAAQTPGVAQAPMQAGAQTPATACTTTVIPPELTGWTKPTGAKSGDALVVGRGALLALLPSAGVRFAVAPAKPPVAGSFSATASFDVATAGTYRVALSGPVWVDVVGGGKALASATHSHGPACSPVKKMVDFVLVPGRYALELSSAKSSSLTVLIARAS